MDKLLIRGGRRLQCEVTISGAKNAALPEMCAALLTAEPVTLSNVPRLQDVRTMLKLLRSMGVVADFSAASPDTVSLNAGHIGEPEAPYELVKTMRASILALGPLLARFGRARVSLPGGCGIGSRPVDQHIKGLQAMGAQISVEHGYIVASAERLKGARITTDMVTVTGTENLLMAATLAIGETVLENAAQEPEIPDLAEMLIGMGARIEGHGTSRIRIKGVERLHGVTHRVIPDRIEAGTFLCAVAATGGDVLLKDARADHLGVVIDLLRAATTPILRSNWRAVFTSCRRGTLVSVTGSAVNSAAHSSGNAAFFAPEMLTSPCSERPPRIRSLSMGMQCGAAPALMRLRPCRGGRAVAMPTAAANTAAGGQWWWCAIAAAGAEAAHSAGVSVFIDRAWISSRMRSPRAL